MGTIETGGRSERGAALFIVLALLILAFGIFQIILNGINGQIQENSRARLLNSRSVLEVSLKRRIHFAPALYETIAQPANISLRNCLIDDSVIDGILTNDCAANGVWTGFSLCDEPCTLGVVTGSSAAAPVAYDLSGLRCQTSDERVCAFRVFTEFSPICSGGAGACRQASSIWVRITIQPSAAYTQLKPLVISVPVVINDGSPLSLVKAAALPIVIPLGGGAALAPAGPPPPPPKVVKVGDCGPGMSSSAGGCKPIKL